MDATIRSIGIWNEDCYLLSSHQCNSQQANP